MDDDAWAYFDSVPELDADRGGVSWRWLVHNLVAHPLLVLFPPLGEWLHDRTIDR